MLRYYEIKQEVAKREELKAMNLINQDFSIGATSTTFRSYDEDDIDCRRNWKIYQQHIKKNSTPYDFDLEAQVVIKNQTVKRNSLEQAADAINKFLDS